MLISIIAAVADNGVIGQSGAMPWSLGSDLKRFKAVTAGKPMIMGRKTHVSIGRVLPGRPNLIVTRDGGFRVEGAEVFPSFAAALDRAVGLAEALDPPEVMVIGGAEIYEQAIGTADRIYLTTVHASPEGDAWFPAFDVGEWEVVHRERMRHVTGDSAPTSYQILERKVA